jgi:hypothetical protein
MAWLGGIAGANGGLIAGALVGKPILLLSGAVGGFVGGFYGGLKFRRSQKGPTPKT